MITQIEKQDLPCQKLKNAWEYKTCSIYLIVGENFWISPGKYVT